MALILIVIACLLIGVGLAGALESGDRQWQRLTRIAYWIVFTIGLGLLLTALIL